MAAVTASAITIVRKWTEGGVSGKELKCFQFDIVLSTQGGLTNNIPATAFGLIAVEQSSPLVKNDSSLALVTSPSYDGSLLMVLRTGDATATNHDVPGDTSGTFRGVVKGY